MKNSSTNTYSSLTIDIPTLNGVMVEKFKEPIVESDSSGVVDMNWHNKSGLLHSHNGFPSSINIRMKGRHITMWWHKNGEQIKSDCITIKTQSEIIAEKIAARNFQERAAITKKK